MSVVVVGQIARDLVLRADGPPTPGKSTAILQRNELLGGKGDNLLTSGPDLVALAVPDVGDLLVWKGGSELFEFADVDVVDPTGAGDAFVAALIAALRDGASPPQAGRRASAAASATVQRLGGRPDLSGLTA
ncbi:hypothetical protein KXD96_02145 [Mycobacterium sp. SMC-2]|uniref:PfkB family carbohydrate kinase n=1 Tax=Mycobacterium sp. SMC-2 TaxID=2857058 RepID=UPI0021B24D2F|nr:PfkB family carbohydrate kinase [Mycobacterium sp. SMC-2]UXA06992.1 hypothetical protein KXD96_02145 [Mycobacterium sp. SMC-2]